MKRLSLLVACFLLAALLLSSCWNHLPFDVEESRQQSRVRVLITDAPASGIAKAWVTITRIELIREDGRVTTLSDEPRAFDLLTLRDGATLEMVDVAVDEGTYTELRLVVAEEAEVEFENGETMTLKIPSGTSSGIKVKIPPFVIETETDEIEITIDFDFERSFHRAGNRYLFRPVMHPKSMIVNGVSVSVPQEDG